jgi:translocation and assembly module TamA
MVSRVSARASAAAICLALVLCASAALAQDSGRSLLNPFSWFGPAPPTPRADALPYRVELSGLEAEPDLAAAARDASLLRQTADDPPLDGEELARRVEADLPRITDAIWARGRYAASVTISIGPAAARIGAAETGRLARAAEQARNREVVAVVVTVDPGPVYRFATVDAVEAGSGRPLALAPRERMTLFGVVRARDDGLGLKPGDPAATSAVLAAAARLSDRYRAAGHPFVRVSRRPPVIDHRDRTVDLVLTVDPGPVAALGSIAVTGTQAVDPAVVRSFIYAEPGDPYSPQALTAIRKSVSRIEALGAVRVKEGEALYADGRLPLEVQVTERPPRLIGASARYSTVDGPALKAYWAHRNLFGGAERLRLDADLFYTRLERDGKGRKFELRDLGGRLSASFLKPALGGSRFDLLADASVERSRTEAYDADIALGTLAIRRRFSDTFSVQIGVEAEAGDVLQAPSPFFLNAPRARTRYGLVGLPLAVTYDSTDRPLDPTSGVRVTGSIAPYKGFRDAPAAFGIGRFQLATYLALDADARFVLAARGAVGSIFGGAFDEIPPTRRFYAGGGGSVRGYDFRSLSPKDAFGRPLGGRSLVEASLEARIKVTETIGVVPFVDVGQAFAGSTPDRSERLRIGAGVGLRYYTSLGPIRVDVAVPVGRRRGETPYALYVSIGQAF